MGLYLLDILTKEFGHDKIGLYRDYRLGCSQSLSVPESEKVKKKLWKSFRQSELSINVEWNLQISDFFDVIFDLRTDKSYPYRKDNNQLLYINKKSNHPPIIIKQIPSMVSRRISDVSCNKEYFHNKHFLQHHKYHKLFNRNNVKISYSCMQNMVSVIRNHNTSSLKDPTPTDIKERSCCQKPECQLPNTTKYKWWTKFTLRRFKKN